jgi:hypothetical protein
MLETLLSILIIAIVGTGAYYAAHYIVNLRHNRDMLADEYKRATEHIEELEARVMLLEAERDTQMAKFEAKNMKPSDGYDVFSMRS